MWTIVYRVATLKTHTLLTIPLRPVFGKVSARISESITLISDKCS